MPTTVTDFAIQDLSTRMEMALAPPIAGIAHHFAEVGGVRLHYAESGAAHGGAPIVMLHGFPELWYAWRHQLVELGRTHRVIAPDLPGYGLSSRPREIDAYSVERVVGQLVALCDALGADRLHLVGHDWGGALAWAFAARHPDRVARLVIVNAPHPATFRRELRRSPRQMLASSYVLLFRSRLAEPVLRAGGYALLDRLVRRGLREGWLTEQDAAVYRAAWREPGALTGGLNYYRASRPHTGPRDDRVTVPTLVLWGDRDRYLRPGLLRGLERHVPDLRIERVADATHWIVHERPAFVTEQIRRFVLSPTDR
jgi:pimeloyl-ACP methyl ester carboxylesterase